MVNKNHNNVRSWQLMILFFFQSVLCLDHGIAQYEDIMRNRGKMLMTAVWPAILAWYKCRDFEH